MEKMNIMVLRTNKKPDKKPDKKRQRISTGTSNDFSDDDNDFDDFVKMSLDQKLFVMFKQISSTRTKVDDMYHDDLNGRVQTMEGVMSDHEKRIKLLEYRSIDLEARSRRRNLLFKGITEYGVIENCSELVRDLIADTLHISDDFYLERANSLGRFKPGSSKPRPIIVAFRDYYDTEVILQQVQSLKGTNYAVCRDCAR